MFSCCQGPRDDKFVKYLIVNLKESKADQKVTYETELLPSLKDNEVSVTVQFATITVQDKSKFDGQRGIGISFSGSIKKVGPAVKDLKAHDTVYGFYQSGFGAVADQIIVPANQVIKTPKGVPQDVAATLPLLYLWEANAEENVQQFTVVLIQSSNPLINTVLQQKTKQFDAGNVVDKEADYVELYYRSEGDVVPKWKTELKTVDYEIKDAALFDKLAQNSKVVESVKSLKPALVTKKDQLSSAIEDISKEKANFVVIDVAILAQLEQGRSVKKETETAGK
jgi:hypothetical protein